MRFVEKFFYFNEVSYVRISYHSSFPKEDFFVKIIYMFLFYYVHLMKLFMFVLFIS